MRELLVTALLGSWLRPHPSASTLLLSFPTVIQPFPPLLPLPSVMATPHVIASSSTHTSQPATTTGVVGNHFRVGKKIGEGSFGVVFEGAYRSSPLHHLTYRSPSGSNLLTNHPVAIKFVCYSRPQRKYPLNSERQSGTAQVGRTATTRRVPVISHLEWHPYVPPLPLGRLSSIASLNATFFCYFSSGLQLAFPRCITSAKRDCITSSQSISWVPISKTYSTCAVENFRSRPFAWRRNKW